MPAAAGRPPPEPPFSAMPILLAGSTARRDTEWVARADRPFSEAKAELVARFERDYLKDLLLRAGNNISQAARISGIDRKHLYRLLESAGLHQPGAKA